MSKYPVSKETMDRLRSSGTYVRDGYSAADAPLETLLIGLLDERDDLIESIEYLEGRIDKLQVKLQTQEK